MTDRRSTRTVNESTKTRTKEGGAAATPPASRAPRWLARGGVATGGMASLVVGAVLGGIFEGIPVVMPHHNHSTALQVRSRPGIELAADVQDPSYPLPFQKPLLLPVSTPAASTTPSTGSASTYPAPASAVTSARPSPIKAPVGSVPVPSAPLPSAPTPAPKPVSTSPAPGAPGGGGTTTTQGNGGNTTPPTTQPGLLQTVVATVTPVVSGTVDTVTTTVSSTVGQVTGTTGSLLTTPTTLPGGTAPLTSSGSTGSTLTSPLSTTVSSSTGSLPGL